MVSLVNKVLIFIEAALQLEQGMASDYLMQIQAAFFMKEVQTISLFIIIKH